MRKLVFLFVFIINCLVGSSQNVGIGTTAPTDKLTVQSAGYGLTHTNGTATIGTWIGSFQGVSSAMIGTKSNHPLSFFTNNGNALMTIATNGYVGIGNTNPVNKLHVGTGTNQFVGFDVLIGNGSGAMGFAQTGTATSWYANTNISVYPNSGNGYFGINTFSPANKLQIGSVGATGFNGNDLAIGNGAQAMAIYQSATATLFATSTTDIILRPRNNGQGRVGINTNTPRAPLDVVDGTGVNALAGFYSYLNFSAFVNGVGSSTNNPVPNVSIMASGRVYAEEFDAYSDARIKSINGTSNPANDLETINALQIRDYRMKDKVKYGDKTFKKVIAQEVEKVYPQVVSKHVDFIPNVYQVTNKIEKTANGYLLTLPAKHTISPTAKKIQLMIAEGKGMQQFDIVSIPSDNQIILNTMEVMTDKVFVYGEEVVDFRTIDYEGLSTLNISATQELSRLLKQQQAAIEVQNLKIAELTDAIRMLTEKGCAGQP